MRKFLVFLFPVVLAVSCLSFASGSYPVLSDFSNDCSVLSSSSGNWAPAVKGAVLSPSDTIKTGRASFAEISMTKENIFRLKSDTEVVLNAVEEKADIAGSGVVKVVSLNLNDGWLLAMFDNIPDGTVYEVQSPIATAGATGTEFTVSYSLENDRADVSVSESSVVFSTAENADKSVRVGQFEKTSVSAWETALLRARGNGILSQKILGKDFVAKVSDTKWIKISRQESFDSGLYGDDARAGADARKSCMEMIESRIEDMELESGAKVSDIIRDPQKLENFLSVLEKEVSVTSKKDASTVTVTVQVPVSVLNGAVGSKIKDDSLKGFEVISQEDYSARFGAQARITTIRAAQVDAVRKLAEQIYGAVVTSKTTIKDMAAENDLITTRVEGMVKGAETDKITYFSDGSIAVSVIIRGTQIYDELSSVTSGALGETYLASPVKIGIDEFIDIAAGRKN